jgi:hypothetical protein
MGDKAFAAPLTVSTDGNHQILLFMYPLAIGSVPEGTDAEAAK